MNSTIILAWTKVTLCIISALAVNGPLWLISRTFGKLAELFDWLIFKNLFKIGEKLGDQTINKGRNARHDRIIKEFLDRQKREME